MACAGLRGQNDHVTSGQSELSGVLPLRDMDPRDVGVYRLLGRLGEGGQGVVFLAAGPDEGRAAVKLLPPTTDPQVRSRFLKEVAAAQRVAQFCTAQILDAGIFERRPFIVSEYVSGPSLVEVVEQFGPRSGAALERIAVATLAALGAVHAVGMVHRDFKPGNVLLGPDGPVVIDFGLATVPGMTTTIGTSGHVAIGTPAYMAPEQLAAERVTAAADMWSWAVTMAFAGTGELPFKGESLTATAYAILHSEAKVRGLPEPLGFVVHRCLSKDPALRPSARGALSELVAAGARFVGPMPPVAVAPDSEEGPTGPVWPRPQAGSDDGLIVGGLTSRPGRRRHGRARTSRRRRAATLLTLIVLAAGAGGLAFTLSQRTVDVDRNVSLDRPTAAQTSPLTAEAEARTQAVQWIVHQVSFTEGVACDIQVCTDLIHAGFPVSDVQQIQTTTNDPLTANLVVATAGIRNQFGSLLAVYAPAVIASFGKGNARIDIMWVYPEGLAQYNIDMPAMLRARKEADALLATNSRIQFSPIARAQLLSGQVDPSLPQLFAIMAHYHPLHIVDFPDESPGGGPASLLRWADLATTVPQAHISHAAYLAWLRTYFDAQRTQYLPNWDKLVTLANGEVVLRVGYGAPSSLNPDLGAAG
jgi:protein kinase-like protein